MKQVPLFYHPTTLCWIDDDELFLNVATDHFRNHYRIKTMSSAKKALETFSQYHSHINPLSFLRGCEEHEDYDLNDHLPVDLDFSRIRQVQNDLEKLNEIAVMIIDYRMPEISGIELCEQLSTIPAKKILLTGNANPHDAINAFNKGIINYFICKDDPNIDTVLSENINRLCNDYFIDRTTPLLHHIESDYKLPQSDSAFAALFDDLCKKHNIKEYYLSDKNGGIIMIDQDGNSSYLVVHTDRTLDYFVDLHCKDNMAIFFVKSVRERSKIPFFGPGKEMWGIDSISWADYFYKPNILEGREKYYWTLVSL